MSTLLKTVNLINWLVVIPAYVVSLCVLLGVTRRNVVKGVSFVWSKLLAVVPSALICLYVFCTTMPKIVALQGQTSRDCGGVFSILLGAMLYVSIWGFYNLAVLEWNSYQVEIDKALELEEQKQRQQFWQTLVSEMSLMQSGLYEVDQHGHILGPKELFQKQ